MTILFIPVALDELQETFDFYEQQLPGLGKLFLKETFETIELIRLYHQGFQLITTNTRKCSLRKFPYMVLYGIVNNTIVISAIAHQHRHPRSYLDR